MQWVNYLTPQMHHIIIIRSYSFGLDAFVAQFNAVENLPQFRSCNSVGHMLPWREIAFKGELATPSANGLMSAADKIKLDAIKEIYGTISAEGRLLTCNVPVK